MRIAFFNVTASSIPGGLETYCWEAGRALARLGHDVTIVAGNRGEARHSEVRLVQFPFKPEKEWPDFGVRFRRLAERLSFASHGALEHLLDAGYDAIIANKPFDFPILWRARRAGLKSITLFRSGGTDFFPADRWFAGSIDRWASSSRYNAKQISSRYGRPVEVIHNGVDTDAFSSVHACAGLRARYAGPSQSLVVSVGRLVGWKGIHVVINAIASLPTLVYLIVGTGPEEGELKMLASRLGVSERVIFVGRVAHEDLPQLLAQCDVFVQPSVGEEAFGISVIEAMASGVPVIASDNGGLPEIVENGVTGLLLRPGDTAAWRRGLADLADDPPRARRMGAAARQRAVAHFTWSANAARHESLLFGDR